MHKRKETPNRASLQQYNNLTILYFAVGLLRPLGSLERANAPRNDNKKTARIIHSDGKRLT